MNRSGGIGRVPLLVITGATATGKTFYGIEVARMYGGEVISADSMQVYRYMNIGTAKPSLEERRGVPHHLIDILDPDERFSVADFQRMATRCANEIHAAGRLPIVVGGTALYIKALTAEYDFPEIQADHGLRERLKAEAAEKGASWLHGRLREIDPDSADRLHPNDLRRVIRALEVYYLTGKTMSSLRCVRAEGSFDCLIVGLDMSRPEIYRRIEDRVDRMIAAGLIEEVRALLDRGYSEHLPSMQGLGYAEMVAYLKGRATLPEAVRVLKRNTRNFAKRQLTWFRNDPRIRWVNVGNDRPQEAVLADLSRLIEGKWYAA